ncbi:MAG: DNRLRE domain-containing protein [Candidatus Cloacimonetes bacterium]|nr:DNRLRE domain-containing protein [Candidatus Cloacimonadota bacterium]
MKKYILFISLISIIFYILSCSQKKNIIGFDENVEIIAITITDSINFVTTYKDSIKNYNNNTKLIVGKFNDVEVRSLLKFENLPDTSWIDTVTINSCEIVIQKDILFNEENFNIKIYEVTKDWNENSVVWDSSNFLYNEDFDFNVSQEQDTITFSIDTTLVKDWIESDSLNYGIMLKCENVYNNFVEFSSSETDNSPYLKIVYTDSTSTKMDTINYNVSEDTFIGNNSNSDSLDYTIANLPPIGTIFEFNLPDSLCKQNFQINKAEMIITSDLVETFFISEAEIEITPYYVSDTVNIDYEFINDCSTYEFNLDSDTLKINITGIIQGYTNGELENNRILLKSTTENKDFSYIKFEGDITPDLRIIYTKPVLD